MDAGYAYKANDHRCVSGGVAMCAGACALFHPNTQKCVALSDVYVDGVRGDGHGPLRDGFDAVHLEFNFPSPRSWGVPRRRRRSRGRYIRGI